MSVLSVPNTFVPAATILSGQVNANFSSIVTWAATQQGLTIGAGSIGSAGVTGKWPDQVLNIGTIVSNNFTSWRAAVTAIGTATHLWALSDSSGTIAVDAIGSSNGVYVGGPTLGAPLLRQNGVGLSGTGQYVTFPGIELPAAAPWSIECYAAYTGASSGYVISSSELQILEATASAITTTTALGGSSPASPTLSFTPVGQLGNIAVDNAGLIYSNTSAASIVRRYTQSGTLASTVTLSAPTGASSGAIAVDTTNNIYIADAVSFAAYKYSAAGLLLVTYTTGSTCFGVAVDSSGLVYTLDSGGNVRRFANAGGAQTLSITPPTVCQSLGVDTSGNIYVHSNTVASVYKYGSTGTLLNTFPVVSSAGFSPNRTIPVDATGSFWIAYNGTYGISKYSSAGTLLVTVPLNATTYANGLAVDFGNNVYVNHNNPGTLIEKYSPTATTATLAYAFGASVQPNHHIVTYDGTTMRYFINGVMVGSSAAALVTNPGANLVAGAFAFPLGNAAFQGVLSNIVTYSSALTGAQISSIYNAI